MNSQIEQKKDDVQHQHDRHRFQYTRVLIPTDSKEIIELIIPFAKKFLKKEGEIVTLNVIDSSHPLEVIDQWKKGTKISIAAVEAGYRNEVRVTPKVVNHRSVAGGITEELRKGDYDLLLFVINPHSGKRSFRFGSKTRSIARTADRDMMMISHLTLLMDSRPEGTIFAVTGDDSDRKRIRAIAALLSEEMGDAPVTEFNLSTERTRTAEGGSESRSSRKKETTADRILRLLSESRSSALVISTAISSRVPFYRNALFEKLIKESPSPIIIFKGKRR